jgi:indoleamine 2,3-dioxygenase
MRQTLRILINKMLTPEGFGVSSRYGFLSPQPPLNSFHHRYYAPWDDLGSRLPDLIRDNELEQAIHDLPMLDIKHLTTNLDYQRAYTILAFAVHGFVWSSAPPRDLIPQQLSEPFLQVCEAIGMRPVISYAGLCIWNWQSSDMGTKPELESMSMVASFTGTRGEAAFYHVPVLVEYVGGHLVGTFLDAMRALEINSADTGTKVINALQDASRTIEQMGKETSKLYPVLDADFFYHELRPWIGGGRGVADNGLPRGMVFQRSDGSEVEARFAGGSAIQSSLFPFLDHALGVAHGDQMFAVSDLHLPGRRALLNWLGHEAIHASQAP